MSVGDELAEGGRVDLQGTVADRVRFKVQPDGCGELVLKQPMAVGAFDRGDAVVTTADVNGGQQLLCFISGSELSSRPQGEIGEPRHDQISGRGDGGSD